MAGERVLADAGYLTAIGAVPVSGPGRLRRYIIDCRHGTTDLMLSGRGPTADVEVFARLLGQHRHAIAQTEKVECACEPSPAQRVKLLRSLI